MACVFKVGDKINIPKAKEVRTICSDTAFKNNKQDHMYVYYIYPNNIIAVIANDMLGFNNRCEIDMQYLTPYKQVKTPLEKGTEVIITAKTGSPLHSFAIGEIVQMYMHDPMYHNQKGIYQFTKDTRTQWVPNDDWKLYVPNENNNSININYNFKSETMTKTNFKKDAYCITGSTANLKKAARWLQEVGYAMIGSGYSDECCCIMVNNFTVGQFNYNEVIESKLKNMNMWNTGEVDFKSLFVEKEKALQILSWEVIPNGTKLTVGCKEVSKKDVLTTIKTLQAIDCTEVTLAHGKIDLKKMGEIFEKLS